ncbi:MAG: hypothetical protein J6Y78_11230 [Paludibacteraceae bacterium]|nr:hypothetical protein [Paludibacteraceae bacterium]
MIIDNTKGLLTGILIVLMLLSICVAVDYADNTTTITMKENKTNMNLTNYTLVNDTKFVDLDNESGIMKIQNNGKVIIQKPTLPRITATGKPSCGCGRRYSYRWYTRTYINYCPHCHRYNVLYNAHKRPARFEQELTCLHCGADYCINCGKEKYSWSKYYLRKG